VSSGKGKKQEHAIRPLNATTGVTEAAMNELVLRLTEKKREVLRQLLDSALAESRVEVHRTHFSPGYREQVLEEESCIASLLKKLSQPVMR
jgi:hypothetical protein